MATEIVHFGAIGDLPLPELLTRELSYGTVKGEEAWTEKR